MLGILYMAARLWYGMAYLDSAYVGDSQEPLCYGHNYTAPLEHESRITKNYEKSE